MVKKIYSHNRAAARFPERVASLLVVAGVGTDAVKARGPIDRMEEFSAHVEDLFIQGRVFIADLEIAIGVLRIAGHRKELAVLGRVPVIAEGSCGAKEPVISY